MFHQIRFLHRPDRSKPHEIADCSSNIPSSTTDLGEGELDTPHLALVAQAELADSLELSITSRKIVRNMYTT